MWRSGYAIDDVVMKILAVITARGGSKGVERKNVRVLNGKPLIIHTIDCALSASNLLYKVIVSTEDAEIADLSVKAGVEVPFLRPAELAADDTPTLPVLTHAVRFVEESDNVSLDWVLVLQPTSPLRLREDIAAAVSLAQTGDFDTIVSVKNANDHHPLKIKKVNINENLIPFIDGAVEPLRRQDLSPNAYKRNGAIYLIRRDRLEEGRLYGDSIRGLVMPEDRSIDIDTELDFLIADMLMSRRDLKNA